jgi:cephalosporin hydroxylase
MRISIDTDARTLEVSDEGTTENHDLYSKEAFDRIADLWVRTGWVRKYSYGFTWLGRPIIQLPDDMVRIQEAVFAIQPDVIIETGIAHGGSLIYLASLLELIGKGQVIGIDIDIRPHNRRAIEVHPMMKRITMVEGSSIDPAVAESVRAMIGPGQAVMLILDSNHSRDHVASELAAYADLVTPGSCILVQDGVMKMVAGMPRSGADWDRDHPVAAVEAFLATHPEFEFRDPIRPFDETLETPECSHHPSGWLWRKS